MKKNFSTFLAICFIAVCCATPTFAATKTYDSNGMSFERPWELTAGNGGWLMKSRYNTTWINEDYTHTYHSSKHHVATVSNSNGSFSDEGNGGNWAGIEVRHNSNYVIYSMSY